MTTNIHTNRIIHGLRRELASFEAEVKVGKAMVNSIRASVNLLDETERALAREGYLVPALQRLAEMRKSVTVAREEITAWTAR